jgi:hypothetical protein
LESGQVLNLNRTAKAAQQKRVQEFAAISAPIPHDDDAGLIAPDKAASNKV